MRNSDSVGKITSYLPGVIAIFLWSTGAYFIFKMKNLPVSQILVVGQLVGGLISIYFEKSRFSLHSMKNRIRKGWAILAIFWISQYGYIYAFQNAPPAQINLIFYTWPAILIIIKAWNITRKLNKWDIAGIWLGFMGIAILLSPDLKQDAFSLRYLSGYLGSILGALGWVAYLLYTDQEKKDKKGFTSIGEDILILGIFNFFHLMITEHWIQPNTNEWMMLSYYSVSMFGIPYYLWRITLKKDPKMAGALSNATPVLSIIWLILAKITPFTIELVVSIVMVNLGIYCIDRSAKSTSSITG